MGLTLAPGGRQPKQGQQQRERLTGFLDRHGDGLKQPLGNAELGVGSHESAQVAWTHSLFSPRLDSRRMPDGERALGQRQRRIYDEFEPPSD